MAAGALRIISYSSEKFKNRSETGYLLAQELKQFKGQNPVVLGIPRGGIILASEIAKELDGEMDIVLSRKLRTPGQPELAMGSISENGTIFLNESLVNSLDISPSLIHQEKTLQMGEILRRSKLIRSLRPRFTLSGRVVIVTDDGVATGATAQAALWSVRQENPKKLIAAFPVASEEAIERLAKDVDELVCLRAPPFFYAVGQFYQEFDPVEDEDVVRILKEVSRGDSMWREVRQYPMPGARGHGRLLRK